MDRKWNRSRTINDEPWFVGKDVADVLGYEATRNAIAKHVDDEDKLTHRFDASGQGRDMIIINESGLYSLILSSKLPGALLNQEKRADTPSHPQSRNTRRQ